MKKILVIGRDMTVKTNRLPKSGETVMGSSFHIKFPEIRDRIKQ